MNSKIFNATNLFIVFVLFCAFAVINAKAASQFDIIGPEGSGGFGGKVTALPNGNLVITDSGYDAPGPIENVGAVYLYNGKTGALISRITGSSPNDYVGDGTIQVLPSGNFVFINSDWKNVAQNLNRAVTWCNGTTGCSGTVSESNSLVGTGINVYSVVILTNGNFVVPNAYWNNGTAQYAGAVTWCSGTNSCSGRVSAANSLVGISREDYVGKITPLPNGNYVVVSSSWDNGHFTNVGAITWGNGWSGTSGEISAANSLIGSKPEDQIGDYNLFVLPNSNYVAISKFWDNGTATDVGAVTWGNGEDGTVGETSAANSLIGTQPNDLLTLSFEPIAVLTNGNYVVGFPSWDNGAATDAGAVILCNGKGGTVGEISALSSLVGTKSNDNVGKELTALKNGNYVVASPNWSNGTTRKVGAVTWGNGLGGTVGEVSTANSLVGSQTDDFVGWVRPLTNGNYIVLSRSWSNGAAVNAGAITWGNGFGGTVGTISATNSLVGTQSNDLVGNICSPDSSGCALTNGNYVVSSPYWSNGTTQGVGAVTWGNGLGGTVGEISATNSLIGEHQFDAVGVNGTTPLSNGNYVVSSRDWKLDSTQRVGAVTWGNGLGGTVGRVSRANSLIGSQRYKVIGWEGNILALPNGNYLVLSVFGWYGSSGAFSGAVTWGNGAGGTAGVISLDNSLLVAAQHLNNFSNRVFILPNGNYLVRTPDWGNGKVNLAGAITWGNGLGGTVGKISAANSLIGSASNDHVGSGNYYYESIAILPNSNYIVISPDWKKRGKRIGAVTLGAGNGGTIGEITAENSVYSKDAPNSYFSVAYDSFNETMVVGYGYGNRVTIFKPTYTAVSNGDWSAATTWDYGAFTQNHDVYIPEGKTINLDVADVVSSLKIACKGAITGADSSANFIGKIEFLPCQQE